MYVVVLLWLFCQVGTRLHIRPSYVAGRSVPLLTSTFLLLCYRYRSLMKTVFRYTHKAVDLFHRLWTSSQWPAISPHPFVRVSAPPSISSSFKLTNRYCSSRVKADEVNKQDRSKQTNSFNCPTHLVSSSSITPEIEKLLPRRTSDETVQRYPLQTHIWQMVTPDPVHYPQKQGKDRVHGLYGYV